MRTTIVVATLACCVGVSVAQTTAPAKAFDLLQSLVGEWEADLPGFGKLTNSIRLISNGVAIEETLGTTADNETSIYTRDGNRILLTHFCALTSDGHVVRLVSADAHGAVNQLEFHLTGSTNLHSPSAAHMEQVSLTVTDANHFSERWTKTQSGKDTVFDLHFVRR
jgi:hypothetical protein